MNAIDIEALGIEIWSNNGKDYWVAKYNHWRDALTIIKAKQTH